MIVKLKLKIKAAGLQEMAYQNLHSEYLPLALTNISQNNFE